MTLKKWQHVSSFLTCIDYFKKNPDKNLNLYLDYDIAFFPNYKAMKVYDNLKYETVAN